MKRIVEYISKDPLYSNIVQTYIGINEEELDNIQYETEEYMKSEYSSIYQKYDIKYILDESKIT